METRIFPVDKDYFARCRKQFRLSYEGKTIPLWEEDKSAMGVAEREHSIAHLVLGSL